MMNKMIYNFRIIFFVLIFVSIFINYSSAEIYKFKDKDGHWHFTDTPLDASQGDKPLAGMIKNKIIEKDLYKLLSQKLPQRTEIEKAIYATVAIKTVFGHGTGFFITDDGFILTNRHVVKGDTKQFDADLKKIDITEAEIKKIRKKINNEFLDLKARKQYLDQCKLIIEKQPVSAIKKNNMQLYENNLKQYQSWKKDFTEREKKFIELERDIKNKIGEYKYKKTISTLARTFKVFLADNTKLTAFLVSTSKKHDLALLKLDGYKTPFLKSGNPFQFATGESVYAIGNPIVMRNSVSKGIISGFEKNFIKTDAKIYPGNSGGPLIVENGKVIGINTFKKLTNKYEGLGFAIFIGTALDEFRAVMVTSQ